MDVSPVDGKIGIAGASYGSLCLFSTEDGKIDVSEKILKF
jgi:hypothetical protein